MLQIESLTKAEFQKLLDGYFAPPEKRSMMTETEVKNLASRLNKKIDVPVISATQEEKILIKVILRVDQFLYDHLPNEFYDLVRSIDKGIDDAEADRLIGRLSKLANKHIDLPYLPEWAALIGIRFVIGAVINGARKNLNLEKGADKISEEI